jgi:hypothetical protein
MFRPVKGHLQVYYTQLTLHCNVCIGMYLSYTPIVHIWGFVCYKTLIVIVQNALKVLHDMFQPVKGHLQVYYTQLLFIAMCV